MPESDTDPDFRLRFLVLNCIGGQFLCATIPDEPPLLGERYLAEVKHVFVKLDGLRKQISSQLAVLSDSELPKHFSRYGNPLTDTWKAWAADHRTKVRSSVNGLDHWHLAAFGDEKMVANFDYWSKAAFFRLDEVVWLSVGLEPAEVFKKALDTRQSPPNPIAEEMKRRRELFRRELEPNFPSGQHDPQDVLGWVNRVGLEVHSGFRKMLHAMVSRNADIAAASDDKALASPTPTVSEEAGERMDRREKTSLAKLLVAIAIEEYGYDPKAARSSIPNEIASITERLGLNVSRDTISKYLQLGAKHLPADWTPHK